MRGAWLAGVLAWAACSAPPPASNVPNTALATSLQVDVGAEVVTFALHVTNPTRTAVELRFPTGQRYDFSVMTPGGGELWRWSAGQMFTQAVGADTLAPGQSVTYRAEWRPSNQSGRFTARGWVTSEDLKLEQATEFEVR
ncbi:MAG TPA: BsuPI-related putative proteinase inhibitor [Longimicrobiales bacterium]|nr:BsuPI-related putative proteinase inhibitor [Longimicrobiales bacterium]